jgi:hypothetical protein
MLEVFLSQGFFNENFAEISHTLISRTYMKAKIGIKQDLLEKTM